MGQLLTVGLDDLIVTDEASFSHLALFSQLKLALRQSGQQFRVPQPGSEISWDRAVFLNLTFWNNQEGGDVLCDATIPADVVCHVAWHSLAARKLALNGGASPSASCADALFFAEAIASAFDLYLVGRLLRNVPDSDFIATQVPIMAEAAEQGHRRLAVIGAGELAEIIAIVSEESEVKIAGFIAPDTQRERIAGLPVVTSWAGLDRADGAILAILENAGAAFDAFRAEQPAIPVFVPRQLRSLLWKRSK